MRTDADIKAAAREWCTNPVRALAEYGHISCWNVSQVTNMDCLFEGQHNFNEDLSQWKVENVKSMHAMFRCSSKVNQDVSIWKVENVQRMSNMFWCASNFNQDLSDWAVSADIDMYYMSEGWYRKVNPRFLPIRMPGQDPN